MITVTVDRSRWMHGGNTGFCTMFRCGKFDIFGFIYNQAFGYSEDRLENRTGPAHLTTYYGYPKHFEKDIVQMAMEVNDSKRMDNKDRERLLTKIFKGVGIQLKFINRHRRRA